MRILYKNETGALMVAQVSDELLSNMSINEAAPFVVPTGKPYKIIDVADIPADRTLRDAWDIDEALLTDGVGA